MLCGPGKHCNLGSLPRAVSQTHTSIDQRQYPEISNISNPGPLELGLRGRHAVVTGGGSGIGLAAATALALRGARVTLMGRDAARLQRTAAVLAADGHTARTVVCDVESEAGVASAFADARTQQGPVNLLVGSAGPSASARLVDTDLALWNRMLAVDLTGVFLCARAVLPEMLEARAGRIVNIASTAGLRGYNRMAAYCAAKHGVVGLTRALALETAKHGITVNAVCPGYTETGMVEQAVDNLVAAGRTPVEARAMLTRITPRGALTTPEEVASLVAWLCGDDAAAVTGASIPVAGGEVF